MAEKGPTPLIMLLPLFLLVAAGAAAGILPQVREICIQGAVRFIDARGYHSAVLTGTKAAAVMATGSRAPGLDAGAAAALAALAVAGMFLAPVSLPRRAMERLKDALLPVSRVLRTAHSGYIGDYVTWFMIGAGFMLLVSVAR